MRFWRAVRNRLVDKSGVALMETLVALAVLGAVGVTLLTGMATSSKAAFMTQKRSVAESIAQSQTEWVKADTYVYEASEYAPSQLPGSKDYLKYSVTIAAVPLRTPDDGIQKIVITVSYAGEPIFKIESYKVDR